MDLAYSFPSCSLGMLCWKLQLPVFKKTGSMSFQDLGSQPGGWEPAKKLAARG